MSYAYKKCCVPFCKNNKTDEISMHTFPCNIDMRQMWIRAIFANLDPNSAYTIREHSLICSEHFTESCFSYNNKHKRSLKKDAVPTKFKVLTQRQRKIYQRKYKKTTNWSDMVTNQDVDAHGSVISVRSVGLPKLRDKEDDNHVQSNGGTPDPNDSESETNWKVKSEDWKIESNYSEKDIKLENS